MLRALQDAIPSGWSGLRAEAERPYFARLAAFLDEERRQHTIYPPRDQVFRALELTPLASIRVVLIGQDPYHGPGQAHGLAFSVPPGVPKPPSLRNLLGELRDDVDVPEPANGDLTPWGRRGVLLLNAVLTVREGEPGSHHGAGWESFTDAVIDAVAARPDPAVFVLLGNRAQEKAADAGDRHGVIEAPHPSPLSAWRGFSGSRVFSRANALLEDRGREPIDWALPD